ncbi:hypothetical protein ECG_06468 [Echinococcus granulosus]|nr:hypothetical protein ECG_06468 [Echinococcus granulosus]
MDLLCDMLPWVLLLWVQFTLGLTLKEANIDRKNLIFYDEGSFNLGYHVVCAACVTYGFLIVFVTIVCIITKSCSRRSNRPRKIKWMDYTQFQPPVLEEAQEFTFEESDGSDAGVDLKASKEGAKGRL